MKIDDETVSYNQMKQDVIRAKRDDADVLETAVYLPTVRQARSVLPAQSIIEWVQWYR